MFRKVKVVRKQREGMEREKNIELSNYCRANIENRKKMKQKFQHKSICFYFFFDVDNER